MAGVGRRMQEQRRRIVNSIAVRVYARRRSRASPSSLAPGQSHSAAASPGSLVGEGGKPAVSAERSRRPSYSSALRALAFLTAVVAAHPAIAVQPDEVLKDPVLEARARALSRDLRCMVCQNQSIDDSEAPLARDIRILVRERLTAGDSDPEVMNFLVARYGEFVLLRPRFAWHTALLWLTPLAVLLAGAIGILAALRRQRLVRSGTTPLTPEEEREVAEMIDRPL
jgi:cytochrome c-type biogenesis protein CcmH